MLDKESKDPSNTFMTRISPSLTTAASPNVTVHSFKMQVISSLLESLMNFETLVTFFSLVVTW